MEIYAQGTKKEILENIKNDLIEIIKKDDCKEWDLYDSTTNNILIIKDILKQLEEKEENKKYILYVTCMGNVIIEEN